MELTNLPGKYPGSKRRLMPLVWPLAPKHDHFVSVFGGIGGELAGKPHSAMETFNDVNADVVNFFKVLREETERLIQDLEFTPYSRLVFNEAQVLLQSDEPDVYERAKAFAIVANQCRAYADPTCRTSNTWAFSYKSHRNTSAWHHIRERLEAVAQRFRRVQLECRPWEWIVNKLDKPKTLFSFDPPYYPSTLASETKMYRYVLSPDDHRRLLERVRNIKGKAFVFGYPCSVYRRLLKDWNVSKFIQHVAMSPNVKHPRRVTWVWHNF